VSGTAISWSVFNERQQVVKDRSIGEKDATLVVLLTILAKKNYRATGDFGMAFGWLAPKSAANGEAQTVEQKYSFDRFESGWRIRTCEPR